MMHKRGAAQLCAAFVLFICGEANAEEEEPFYPTWSLGAGLELSGPGAGAVRPLLLAERRIGHEVWLLARLTGYYHKTSGGVRTGGGEGALGLRYVFTPDEPFQFSTFGAAALAYRGQRVVGADSDAWQGSVFGGVAVERELIEGLGLRLSTVLAKAGYVRETSNGYEYAEWNAQLRFNPSLEMRFAF